MRRIAGWAAGLEWRWLQWQDHYSLCQGDRVVVEEEEEEEAVVVVVVRGEGIQGDWGGERKGESEQD